MSEDQSTTETAHGASRVTGGTPQADDGRFENKYPDSAILQTLAEAFPEPLSNVEIADRCGFSRGTAHNRLHELLDDGEAGLQTKKIGARARVWWLLPDNDAGADSGGADE